MPELLILSPLYFQIMNLRPHSADLINVPSPIHPINGPPAHQQPSLPSKLTEEYKRFPHSVHHATAKEKTDEQNRQWMPWQCLRESERVMNRDGQANFAPYSHAHKQQIYAESYHPIGTWNATYDPHPNNAENDAGSKIGAAKNSYFITEELKFQAQEKQRAMRSRMPSTSDLNIPVSIQGYHDFFPLEPMINHGENSDVISTGANGQNDTRTSMTTTYRVTWEKDANNYCLRRVHDFKLKDTKWTTLTGRWKRIEHPNIVSLRKVFTTRNEFRHRENSLVFIHDYHPRAITLLEFISRREMEEWRNQYRTQPPRFLASDQPRPMLYPESTIWSFIMQMSSAIREVHSKGLAFRTLHDLTKILVLDGGQRFRISCGGTNDVYSPGQSEHLPFNPKNLPQYQSSDLVRPFEFSDLSESFSIDRLNVN